MQPPKIWEGQAFNLDRRERRVVEKQGKGEKPSNTQSGEFFRYISQPPVIRASRYGDRREQETRSDRPGG